ncbi:MAG: hypothetical protein ACX930_02190 [Erythrobacter sp.]
MSEVAAHFLVSLVCALVFANLGRFFLKGHVSTEAAWVGGMALVLGLAIGSAPIFEALSITTRTGIVAGYLLGLTVVWYQFFKREKANG